MTGARRTSDAAPAKIEDALSRGRKRTARRDGSAVAGPRALLGLQRDVGNAAVRALLAGKLRFPDAQPRSDMDAALVELRKDEPAVDKVETGLKAAQSVGIPVELEGPKPPASALAVTKTGFGPGSVAPKKAPPPAKPVPAKSPLGKAAARSRKAGRGAAPPAPSIRAVAPAPPAPAPLSADKLLQPPVPPALVRPEDDPAHKQVIAAVGGFAAAKRAHPPASAKASEAQEAALAPSDDLDSQAKAAKVDTMDAQPVGTFDKKAFISAVKDAVEAKSPKTLEEADDYKESGKANEVKDDVKGLVTSGKQGQSRDLETATQAPPDQSKAVPKPVTPLSGEEPGAAEEIPAEGAAPKPAPAEQLNLEAGKHQTEQEMAEGDVTEQQLQESNEPEFQQAVTDKHAAAAHADSAPGEYREHEQGVLEQSRSEASASTAAAVAGIQGSKAAALAGLVADKGKTKSKDEAKRAEVSGRIQALFAAAEADVKRILDGIDPKVEKSFTDGEADARAAFENYVAAKMAAYKEDRYSGWLGGLRWAKDKLVGMPDKVNEFFEAGRELYLKKMDNVISGIAEMVGNDLTAAKKRIASGRAEVAAYVKSLPRDLKKVGAEATQEIGSRFEQLEQDVDDKQQSVVDTLATKYTEARKGLDDRIEELQAENKGLVDKAIGAIKAVVGTIRDLAKMLMDVLARVADVVGQIIKHPVRFLENLVAGVKGGIEKFKDNIVEHLRKGLMSWLFGQLGDSDIEIPDSFDAKGILKLLASVFGLTWTNIRNRIVRRIGEPAMAAVEKGVDIFQMLASQGIAGVWQMLVDKLGDIKEMILEQVKDYVISRVISAGISFLISLLNPAAAFIKACKLIYEIVMFFVNNGRRIIDLVNAIIDSVADMVSGNVGAVVDKIDDVLGRMVAIIIGFLASLLNLSDIGDRIREIVNRLRKPITKAVDLLVDTGLKLAGPVIRGVAGISGKVKAKIAAGKARLRSKLLGGDDSPEGKQRRLQAGVRSGVAAADRFAGRKVGAAVLRPVLGAIRLRYGLVSLEPVAEGARWAVRGTVSRMTETTQAEVPTAETGTKGGAPAAPSSLQDTKGFSVGDELRWRRRDDKGRERWLPGRITAFEESGDLLWAKLSWADRLTARKPVAILEKDVAAGTTYMRATAFERQIRAEIAAEMLFHPGPYAVHADRLPSHTATPTDPERSQTQDLGRASGCHSCGRRVPLGDGRWRPDHQPPTELVELGLLPGPSFLYPQCNPCSSRQGGLVHSIKRRWQGLPEYY